MTEKTTFHVPWRKSISIFFAVLFTAPILMLFNASEIQNIPPELVEATKTPITVYISVLFLFIMPQVGIWYLSTMSISNEGIVLYRVNKLTWSDILEAHQTKRLGIKSIYIKRKKGIPWSLPLYFVGQLSIKEAILKHVPNENVLYKVAQEL